MTRITTKELMKECRSAASKSSKERSASGGLTWLHGKPASAGEGVVALNLRDGSTVLIPERDIVEADRGEEGEFGVGLAIDANLMVVRNYVRRAFEIAATPGCNCSGATAMTRPFGVQSLGGCIAHCDALENFCMGGGVTFMTVSTTVDDLQDALIHGARCRDIWTGCVSRCFDQTFSRY